MRLTNTAAILGVLGGAVACGKAPADPPQAQPSAQPSSTVAMTSACVKDGSEPDCPGFDGAKFGCPPGWTLAKVEATKLKKQCGPYEL